MKFKHTVIVPPTVKNLDDRMMDMFRWLMDDTDVRFTAKRTPLKCRITGKLIHTTVVFTVNSRDTLDPSDHSRVADIINHLAM